ELDGSLDIFAWLFLLHDLIADTPGEISFTAEGRELVCEAFAREVHPASDNDAHDVGNGHCGYEQREVGARIATELASHDLGDRNGTSSDTTAKYRTGYVEDRISCAHPADPTDQANNQEDCSDDR